MSGIGLGRLAASILNRTAAGEDSTISLENTRCGPHATVACLRFVSTVCSWLCGTVCAHWPHDQAAGGTKFQAAVSGELDHGVHHNRA